MFEVTTFCNYPQNALYLTCASALSFSASTASNKSWVSLSLLTIPSTSDPTKVVQLIRVRCGWLLYELPFVSSVAFYYGGGPLIHDLGQNTHIRIHRRVQFNIQVGVFSFSFCLLTYSLAFPRSHESCLNSFGGGGAWAPFPNSGW